MGVETEGEASGTKMVLFRAVGGEGGASAVLVVQVQLMLLEQFVSSRVFWTPTTPESSVRMHYRLADTNNKEKKTS